MNWFLRAVTSSIGQKVVMAITGLSLCGFLVVHLGGNLLLYVNADQYNHYAHTLHGQVILLFAAEIGLLALFLLHIFLAWRTARENWAARPTTYALRQSKIAAGPLAQPASGVMGITGMVVLFFLLVHLSDFRFELWHHPELPTPEEPYDKALRLLVHPFSWFVYVVGSLALGYHLLHGFESAFQTLGFNHPKYNPIIKSLSVIFAVVVGLGFASFPIWALAIRRPAPHMTPHVRPATTTRLERKVHPSPYKVRTTDLLSADMGKFAV